MSPAPISPGAPAFGPGLAVPTPIPSVVGGAASTNAPGSVRDPAEGFETLLLTQLLKGMRRTVPESADRSTARDLYHELHDEMLATHLARNGGIGIAAIIRAYLERTPGAHGGAEK